jgi:hypothetical protein
MDQSWSRVLEIDPGFATGMSHARVWKRFLSLRL